MTNWYSNSDQEIQQAGTDLCMQINHNAGNIVIEATCNGQAYQRWSFIGTDAGDIMESYYGSSLCLTYNQSKAWVDVVGCNETEWYEQWYTPQGTF